MEEVKGEYGRIRGEEEGNADYGGMVQHVAPFPVNNMLHYV